MTKISVIIPVYYGEKSLSSLCSRIVSEIKDKLGLDYEIILINDFSPDKSWTVIEDLCAKDSKIKGLNFSRNFGQHYAISAGLEHASGDWVVVMDCDGQDQPEFISQLYQAVSAGYHVAVARRGQRCDPGIKLFFSNLFYRVQSFFLGRKIDREVGNFRIISRQVVQDLKKINDRVRLFTTMVDWLGYPRAEVSVQHSERIEGKSSYTLYKLLKLAIHSLLVELDRVIYLVMLGGMAVSLMAIMFGLYIFFRAFFFQSYLIGWSSVICSIAFFSGVIIMIIGLVGLFLGRVMVETRMRPLYIIKDLRNIS